MTQISQLKNKVPIQYKIEPNRRDRTEIIIDFSKKLMKEITTSSLPIGRKEFVCQKIKKLRDEEIDKILS